MVNSIKKGKSFERDVANYLTRHTGVQWHRVPQSGAFATVNKSNDNRFDGDVFTEDAKFQDLVIECKNYKDDINLNALFNKNSLFWGWVEQAETESRDKRWLLFIKITRTGTFIVSKDMVCFETLGLLTSKYLILERKGGEELEKKVYLIKIG